MVNFDCLKILRMSKMVLSILENPKKKIYLQRKKYKNKQNQNFWILLMSKTDLSSQGVFD